MIKAVIFDLGGVIYMHSKQVIPEVLAKIYDVPVEKAISEYGKYKNDYFMGKLTSDMLIIRLSANFKSRKSVAEIKRLWLLNYKKLAKPNTKILKIIEELQKVYKVYLFSNTTEMSNDYNSKTGIYDYFDGIFLSYQMGMKKPESDIYEKVIASIDFAPKECVFIDDNLKNIDTATRLGWFTILFNILKDSPSKLKDELRRLNVRV